MYKISILILAWMRSLGQLISPVLLMMLSLRFEFKNNKNNFSLLK